MFFSNRHTLFPEATSLLFALNLKLTHKVFTRTELVDQVNSKAGFLI